MATPSKIDRLPVEIREMIDRLRTQEGRTIDEIMAKLQELEGVDAAALPGRSALGEYTKEIDAVAEQIKRSRGIAEAMIERYGEEKESKAARLNIELMHGLMTRLLMTDGGPVTLDPKDAMFLSTSLQKLAAASKTDQDREVQRLRELVAKVDEFADQVEAAATGEKGLSTEQVADIRHRVLGVRPAA